MGVRQLETFVKKYVPNGTVPISLIVECRKFKKAHKKKPILVIDFMGLVTIVTSNIEEMLCGGRFNKYKDLLERFFKCLSEVAKLVFFEDGTVVEQKSLTWIRRHSEKYHEFIRVMDMIYKKESFDYIQDSFRENYQEVPRITTQIDLMENVAEKYGTLITTYTRECDSEIARYAYQNYDVLAILANDSDFLIYPGHWRYFSIKDIDLTNMKTLDTIEYSRHALRSALHLNDQELVILSTLNGNDIIKYDEIKETFHVQCHPFKHRFGDFRFPWLADHARKLSKDQRNLMRNIQTLLQCISADKIAESFEMYNPVFDISEETDELLKLCRENDYTYVYATLYKKPRTYTSIYVDFRETPNIFEISMNLFKRQFGIILNHQSEDNYKYEIIAKSSHTQDYRSHYIELIYPPDIPPLIELLQRSEFPEHDEIRFKLLKWMIGPLRLKNFNLSLIPTSYLHDILTLTFLRYYKLIETFEADLILLTIKHVETKTVPQHLQVPTTLDEKAFRTAFLYSKFFGSILRCFRLVGLKEFSKQLNFDGVLFHSLYLKYLTFKFDILQLLGDVKPHRIYK